MAGRGGRPDASPRPARVLAQLAVDRPGSRSVSCPQGTMTPEVYLVLIEFGQEPGRAEPELLRPTLRRLFPDANVRAVVVDNAHDGDATWRSATESIA